MDDMLLTFYCATVDGEAVVAALRTATRAPVHLRSEQVFGHDFDDARTAERVRGSLERVAVTLIVAKDDVNGLVIAVTAARRALPVRWHTSPVSNSGRIA
jgi:prolyl-tRNA editing enzyme YbaK/EbsC (Cys-tRNA(Pro) deacylase)